ncbi:SRPBCC family protein [candidate division CSSED10-310 bacterium]|uniref:SRPBCC family protein n=1 Tax=candidate division CSSED10-310 bacterium TaxID=2855610 RepID=A0ABV6YST0_UNCC1
MAFTVTIVIDRSFEVECAYDKVFELLADVPKSVSHFPKVDQLVDIGDNSYRWEMEKIGVDKYFIQTVYASKYTNDKDEGWVKWVPVPGVGNGIVEGHWKLEAITDDETAIEFHTKGDLTIPLTSFVKFLVSPIVVQQFNSLVDQYHENLKKAFSSL